MHLMLIDDSYLIHYVLYYSTKSLVLDVYSLATCFTETIHINDVIMNSFV